MEILGIDIGGSGIKGAVVDTDKGSLLTERYRIPTPDPAKPLPVANTVAEIARHFDYKGLIGCGFPAVIRLDGQICLLNPSENLSVAMAESLIKERGLQGVARDSLLGWAQRAEAHHRWTEKELNNLFAAAGLSLVDTEVKIGPGLARFARGAFAENYQKLAEQYNN